MHDSTPPTLSKHARALCEAYHCPRCSTAHHVTAELLLVGQKTLVQCHCRACQYSWHATEIKTV